MEPLAQRLGFHEGMAALLLELPAALRELLMSPPGASVTTSPKGQYAFVFGYADSPERVLHIAQTSFEHAGPQATVWPAQTISAVQVAAAFRSPEFGRLLHAHHRKKRSQIRIGGSERTAEWLAFRFVHW